MILDTDADGPSIASISRPTYPMFGYLARLESRNLTAPCILRSCRGLLARNPQRPCKSTHTSCCKRVVELGRIGEPLQKGPQTHHRSPQIGRNSS